MSTETFGRLLRAEREDRGLSIQDVAERIRVDRGVLEALERNDFQALPDETTMSACLEAYADCLEVEADLMIADYEKERERGRERALAAPTTPVGRTMAVSEPSPPIRRLPWPAALVGLAMALAALVWVVTRNGSERTSESPEVTARVASQEASSGPAEVEPSEPPANPAPGVPTPEPIEPSAIEPAREERATSNTPAPEPREAPAAQPVRDMRQVRTDAARSVLTIADYGVGTAVENRQLVGRADRFTEGTQAHFWTRVQGGAPGSRIVHVWLRAGGEEMRRELRVDGPSWRTYSTLVLPSGSAGEWAVEARDEAGRVLARSEFTCSR